MSNTNSHKTAITRKAPSVPMRYLYKQNLLRGKTLDYGCGKGFDAEYFKMDKYDPYYSPSKPKGKYNTITCNYVFNVIEPEKEPLLLNEISQYLEEGGVAYITVRRDIKKEGFTSKKTYQRNVKLNLPILKETSTFCTYILSKK